jgi:hypothetical protein
LSCELFNKEEILIINICCFCIFFNCYFLCLSTPLFYHRVTPSSLEEGETWYLCDVATLIARSVRSTFNGFSVAFSYNIPNWEFILYHPSNICLWVFLCFPSYIFTHLCSQPLFKSQKCSFHCSFHLKLHSRVIMKSFLTLIMLNEIIWVH